MSFFKPRPKRCPVNPAFEKHRQNLLQKAEAGESDRRLGYLPPPMKLSYKKKAKLFLQLRDQALPARYDLRTQERLSPVKDQGLTGTCWAFSTLGSLESCLLPDEEWDFSENSLKNLLSTNCPQGFDRSADGGGNQWMSTAYLARWGGPVNESDDPFNPLFNGCNEYRVRKHLRKVIYIPDRTGPLDNSNIKLGIQNYGAVFTSMYYNDGYYNDARSAYYATGGEVPNHAICLVGWDDNYSRSNFNGTPPGDGAFIVRNSWGAEWGEGGYFYISYYDAWVGKSNALYCKADTPSSTDIIHQYDPLGYIAGYGFSSTTAWFANIFTADSDQYLEGCSFYAASPEATYRIMVYQDVEASKPASGKLAKEMEGKIDEPCYFVKKFASSVFIKKGQQFSIVMQLSTPDWDWPIPVQTPLPGYSSKAVSQPGRGFISKNGKTWYDIYAESENTAVCLKAFARLKG